MIVDKIGRGKYSEIFKVLECKTGKSYAMKVIKKDNLSKTELKVLYYESKIMEVLDHENIV